MAYFLEETKAEESFDMAIYVILSSHDQLFYVSKSKFNSLEETYRTHYYLKNMKTKALFKDTKGTDKLPKMFLLNRIMASERKAFLYCIAWSRYFSDQGYQSLADERFKQYADSLKEEALELYNAISDKHLEDVCPSDAALFTEIGINSGRIKGKKENHISFRITTENYKKVEDKAKKADLSITDYCKKMALSGQIIQIDDDFYKEISECTNKFYERDRILKQILYEIHRTGKYYIADLTLIQSAIDENRKQQDYMLEQLSKALEKLQN